MTRRVLVTDRAWPDLKVEQGILAEIDVSEIGDQIAEAAAE